MEMIYPQAFVNVNVKLEPINSVIMPQNFRSYNVARERLWTIGSRGHFLVFVCILGVTRCPLAHLGFGLAEKEKKGHSPEEIFDVFHLVVLLA